VYISVETAHRAAPPTSSSLLSCDSAGITRGSNRFSRYTITITFTTTVIRTLTTTLTFAFPIIPTCSVYNLLCRQRTSFGRRPFLFPLELFGSLFRQHPCMRPFLRFR
jgi:hypothetical protein